jgi:hypothetical protein
MRITDDYMNFNTSPPFLNFKIRSPSGTAKYDLLCVQLADTTGKIAAGALNQTNTISFGIFFMDMLNGKELFYITVK